MSNKLKNRNIEKHKLTSNLVICVQCKGYGFIEAGENTDVCSLCNGEGLKEWMDNIMRKK